MYPLTPSLMVSGIARAYHDPSPLPQLNPGILSVQTLIVAPESETDDKFGSYFRMNHPVNALWLNATAVTPSPCQGAKRIPLLWGGTQGALAAACGTWFSGIFGRGCRFCVQQQLV